MFRLCMRIPLGESVPLQCVYSLPPSLSPLLLSPPPCSSHHTPSFQLTQPTAQQGLGLSTTTEVCGSQPQMSGVHFMGRIMKPEMNYSVGVCSCMWWPAVWLSLYRGCGDWEAFYLTEISGQTRVYFPVPTPSPQLLFLSASSTEKGGEGEGRRGEGRRGRRGAGLC